MSRWKTATAAAALLWVASVSEAAAPSCTLTFRIGTSTALSSASVFVIYQNAPGDFPGNSTSVQCTLQNGLLGAAADADQTRTLTLTVVGTPTPIKGPKDLAKCTWTPTTRFPVTGDFNLQGQSGFDTSFPQPNQVNAQITISSIECTGSISTTTTTTTTSSTTTSSTTTTLPHGGCGDFDNNGKIQTSDALNVLKAAVGQKACLLCLCDLDGSGSLGASDSLVTLKAAVGSNVQLKCPICG
jgi:hypothetical protein